MNHSPEIVREVMSTMGTKGGQAKSKAKTLAARLNAQKPRPKSRQRRKAGVK